MSLGNEPFEGTLKDAFTAHREARITGALTEAIDRILETAALREENPELAVFCLIALDAAQSRGVSKDGDFPFAWRQLGNFLRLCQGHARECGVTVCLEPLRKADCSLMNLVSEATLIAGLLQLSNIAVAAHWGHMSMASEPMDALWRAAPLLRHIHLENALNRRLPAPGDGEDYARMLSPLNVMGYSGGVSLCGTITGTFPQDAAAAVEYIRGILPTAKESKWN